MVLCRYYYEADDKMINKVNGKKYVYKFELDLRNILGYDSAEIQEQIRHAKQAKVKRVGLWSNFVSTSNGSICLVILIRIDILKVLQTLLVLCI